MEEKIRSRRAVRCIVFLSGDFLWRVFYVYGRIWRKVFSKNWCMLQVDARKYNCDTQPHEIFLQFPNF